MDPSKSTQSGNFLVEAFGVLVYRVGKQKHFANNDEGKEENVGKTFYRKMFSCITAKRAGFGDLFMS